MGTIAGVVWIFAVFGAEMGVGGTRMGKLGRDVGCRIKGVDPGVGTILPFRLIEVGLVV